MTIFAGAFTSGVLLSVVAHMLGSYAGLTLAPVWVQPSASNHDQMLAALGWWTVAGTGFAGSFVAGLLMQDTPGNRRRPMLRVFAGLMLFVLLAAIPFVITAAPATSLRESLLADAASFGLGLFTSFCGSWFSLPR